MTSRLRGWLLPGAAVCLALGILLGRLAGSWWSGAAGLVCAFAAFWLLHGRGRFLACLLAALALGSLWGFFAYHPSLPPEGPCDISGIVSGEVQFRENGQIRTSLAHVTLDGMPLSGGAYWTFYADAVPEALEPGQAVRFQGSLYHPSGAVNPDGYDFREELLRRRILVGVYGRQDLQISPPAFFSLTGFAASLRHRLTRRLLNALGEEAGAYASAMLLGSRSLLSREDRSAFSRLGIAHILSVSGFHVGVLIGLLAAVFRLLRLPQRVRWVLYAVTLLFYSALCGWNQPVLRASLLLLIALRGRMLNRPRPLLHQLSAAWILQLLLSPVQLTGLSFQLSFGAVLGIALITPWLASLWRPENGMLRRLRDGLSAGIGAQLGILLPELYAFQEFPLLALFVNLPVLAYASLLIGLCWAVLLTLPLPWLSVPVCALLRAALSALLAAVRWMGRLPGITLWTPAPGLLTCAALLLVCCGLCVLFRWSWRSRAWMAGVGAALLVLSLIPLPHRGTEYYQLAVQNADAAVLWDRDSVWVMDAGYEDGAVSDFLHRRRLTPEGVILTHLHSDHVFGLRAMMEDHIPIRTLYLPDGAAEADIHPDVLLLLEELRASGTKIVTLSAGDRLTLPSGGITVLWPEKGKTRPGQDANESCLVTRLDLRGTSLLQTGDLDGKYEMYSAVPADVLKVAHHGSARSSSPEYLSAVKPLAALLSTGDESRAASFSERLKGVPLYSTANHGMLTVRFEDHRFSVTTWLPMQPEGGVP